MKANMRAMSKWISYIEAYHYEGISQQLGGSDLLETYLKSNSAYLSLFEPMEEMEDFFTSFLPQNKKN